MKKNWISNILNLLVIVLVTACCNKNSSNMPSISKGKLGKFVYIDTERVLHLKNGCNAVYKDHSSQPVKPQALYSVTYENIEKVCSRCVSEQQMDTLIKFAKKNVGMVKLYNAMKHDDYDVVPFDQFIKDMEDKNNVTTLYHTLIKDNYDIGTFEEFQASLFPEGK